MAAGRDARVARRVGPAAVEVAGELASLAVAWDEARTALTVVEGRRGKALRRAERAVRAATGGVGERRWRAALERRRFHDVADAVDHARALRTRPAVETAVAVREQVRAKQDELVDEARQRVDKLAERLAGYGPLGVRLMEGA